MDMAFLSPLHLQRQNNQEQEQTRGETGKLSSNYQNITRYSDLHNTRTPGRPRYLWADQPAL